MLVGNFDLGVAPMSIARFAEAARWAYVQLPRQRKLTWELPRRKGADDSIAAVNRWCEGGVLHRRCCRVADQEHVA